jgi:hypothetical protein
LRLAAVWLSLLLVCPAEAAVVKAQVLGGPAACASGMPVTVFRLEVEMPGQTRRIPLRELNRLLPGMRVHYEPLHHRSVGKLRGDVALVLLSGESATEMTLLGPAKASKAASWDVTGEARLAAVAYGPRGLSKGKVRGLLRSDDQLISELADYADRTNYTESLLRNVNGGMAGPGLDAALRGLSFGGGSRLDTNASTEAQTRLLVQTLTPALNNYDPLAQDTSQRLAQTAGIAAAISTLYFGQTVGLAAGGAALFSGLKGVMFPNTELRSAFAAPVAGNSGTFLCASQDGRIRGKVAWMWATRLNQSRPPEAALAADAWLPLGPAALLQLRGNREQFAALDRASSWRLRNAVGQSWRIGLNLNRESGVGMVNWTSSPPPGQYELVGDWDWQEMPIAGRVNVLPYPELNKARLTAESVPNLNTGNSRASLSFEGVDFQFVEKLEFKSDLDRFGSPRALPFLLARGKRSGVQTRLETELELASLAPGPLRFWLTQSNGARAEVMAQLLPPHPEIANLPLHWNSDEAVEQVTLRGRDLDRITRLEAEGLDIQIHPGAAANEREITLRRRTLAGRPLEEGTLVALNVHLASASAPLVLKNALVAAGPRPSVVKVDIATPAAASLQLADDELPAGVNTQISLVLQHARSNPRVNLSCRRREDTLKSLSLRAGEASPDARLSMGGSDLLVLNMDAGIVGTHGCELMLTLESRDGGSSAPLRLGRIVYLPVLEKLEFTEDSAGEGMWYARITGSGLEQLDRAGWSDSDENVIAALPAPVGDKAGQQQLRIALRWPSPKPLSPLYLWLRGEKTGRRSQLRY